MTLKPQQLALMMRPSTGLVALVERKPGAIAVVRDMTTDFVLMQAAEILREDAAAIETLYEVSHTNGDVLEIEITARITRQTKGENP